MSLKKFLVDKNYHSIKLKKTATNHFEIEAKINWLKHLNNCSNIHIQVLLCLFGLSFAAVI